MNRKKRVLVAMSGGIDSSVSAIKLQEAGYEVLGVTMKTWDYASSCGSKKQIGCCNLDTIHDAREVAVQIGFPYMVLDIRKEFDQHVIKDFVHTYLTGRTPNPCVLCNTHIKWDALRKRADELQCDYLATGHYAQVRKDNGRFTLYKSKDVKKDQTYALWGLSQTNLERTLFPLGRVTKEEVRAFAQKKGFKNLVTKSESYEICFIPDNDYRSFLKKHEPKDRPVIRKGNFVLEDGTVVGQHEGYPFYTIGQRKGLRVSLGYPLYVVDIHPATNQIVLGPLTSLACHGMYVRGVNMIKYAKIKGKIEALIKVRYNDQGHLGTLQQEDEQTVKVIFNKAVHAITPGQAAVFYTKGGDVIGGGWIHASFKREGHNLEKTS